MSGSTDEQLDLLERRIEALEEQILGDASKRDSIKPLPRTIAELLLQTNAMITTALSCRDAITFTLARVTGINAYLDPTYAESDFDVEDKRCYLMELYPQMKHHLQLLANLAKSISVTNSGNISKVTELSEKLNQLAVKNLNINEESRHITQMVLKALQDYNDITHSLKMTFAQLDVAVTDLETALEPKMKVEE